MAGSRTYRTKVLVLDKTKLKETDLILTMLDERGRQVRAVAKVNGSSASSNEHTRATSAIALAAQVVS